MLVGAPADVGPDVGFVVEDDGALSFAVKLIGIVRANGFSAELIASGSPRKRYDKVIKLKPRTVVVTDMHNGVAVPSFRTLADAEAERKIRALLETVVP